MSECDIDRVEGTEYSRSVDRCMCKIYIVREGRGSGNITLFSFLSYKGVINLMRWIFGTYIRCS